MGRRRSRLDSGGSRLAGDHFDPDESYAYFGNGTQHCRHDFSVPMNPQLAPRQLDDFDWPLAYDAEALLRRYIQAFLDRNTFACRLSNQMRDRTGTDFYEWVDHFSLSPEHRDALLVVGLVPEIVDAPPGMEVYYHPKAMMPRVLVQNGGSEQDVPLNLAIRTESIIDFVARHNLGQEVDSRFGAGLRRVLVCDEAKHQFHAVERLGYRGFLRHPRTPESVEAVIAVRELWHARRRDFPEDADGVAHAFDVQRRAIDLVGPDVACDLFFCEERAYWEMRNRAGQIQKRRQDLLGLGWANHDHHTFRSSRRFFVDLIQFFLQFGFKKRERYYAGAQAGWGAQILEHFNAGITVFADVDLMPEETSVDFSVERLRDGSRLSTVGLWCGLHGDSFLQAGMHHLEARFDFSLLREQLVSAGIATMKPFSDFAFLKQAFTEGERWPVNPERVRSLLARELITHQQAEFFLGSGAVGSHLENLQRKGGFKGFNQKSVSVIIQATDPRRTELSGKGAPSQDLE